MSEIDITKTQVARDWKKIVESSKGQLVFLPEVLETDAKEWNKKRDEFAEYLRKASKMEIYMMNDLNGLIQKLREYYDKAGVIDIWAKDIGFQTEALKEGIYILEISEQKSGR